MLNGEKNEEIILNEFLNEKFDIEDFLEEKYKKYKMVFKIIIICFSIIIIITHFSIKIKKKRTLPSESFEPPKPQQPLIIKSPIKIIWHEPLVNLYIITHKDFKNNVITNPAYKILCDQKTQLTRNYSLEIIETNKESNIIYPKRRGYAEGAKIYPIWKLYKDGYIKSKYVGFFHYRRVFPFKNDIPDLDEIFIKYDVIIKERYKFSSTTYAQYETYHIAHLLNDSVDIIKEIYPEYYDDAKKFLSKNWGNYCNIFIAKKEDFIKWGEFVFGVLLELDRRYNLTTDDDIQNLLIKESKEAKIKFDIDYQTRIQGFLMERIGNIFYDHHWKKRYELETVDI